MKKFNPSRVFSCFAILNVAAVFLVLNLSIKKAAALESDKNWLRNHNNSFYSTDSLEKAIDVLEEKTEMHSNMISVTRGAFLNYSETILTIFKENNLAIKNYYIDEGETKEIRLEASGILLNVIKCMYDLSYSEKNFKIDFLSIYLSESNMEVEVTVEITHG